MNQLWSDLYLIYLLPSDSDVSTIWPLVRSILYRHQGATQKQWLIIMLNLHFDARDTV